MISSQEQNNIDGFESEIQLDQQQITPIQQYRDNQQKINDSQNSKLPPGRSIINDNYSLYPDIATGWNGPQKCSHPIPITVQAPFFDAFFAYLLEKPSFSAQLCYLGPRYDNTFFAWFKMPFEFPYSHLEPPTGMKFTNRPFVAQHDNFKEQHVVFDSFYESANLDAAVYVGDNQYDLFLRVDSNTKGHFQWYNFTISNLKPHQKYHLNICNLQKDFSLYSRGMKPYVLSYKAKQLTGKEWQQKGQNIKYERKICKSMANYDKFRYFYQLSFDVSTKYQNDTIQLAYCIPYTYTHLQKFLQQIKKKNVGSRFYSETKLCKSLGGLPLPLITIAQQLNQDLYNPQKKLKKKCVVLAARVHPGQSNSSYVIQGFINFLCSNNKISKYLRSNIVFKIIPMLNPDGVSFGNYRTGLSGKDFNRQYLKPDHTIFPQISNLKKLVWDYKKKFGLNFLMFIDFHGHATKKNAFMYGPQFTLAQRMYYEARMLPRILSKRTKMFRYYSCIFKIQNEKKNTARAIFLNFLGISLSYTLQISNFSYYDTDHLQNHPFDMSHWNQLGIDINHGLYQYLSLLRTSQMMRADKIRKRQLQKMKQNQRLKKNKTGDKERKRSPKKAGSIKNMKFNFGQVSSIPTDEDDEDFMNYIYKEIEVAQREKNQEIEKMKKNKEQYKIQEQQEHTDSQGKQDDLDEDQLKLLYQCIKKRNKSDAFESINLNEGGQQYPNKMHQKNIFNSIEVNKPKHKRVQSVKIYNRSEKKKSFYVKQPTKIMIGKQVNDQQRIYKCHRNSPALLSFRETKQKPKSFQQFIQTQKTTQKSTRKSFSNNRIYSRLYKNRKQEDDINQISSQFLSPNRYQSPDKQVSKPNTFEQQKMQIYKNLQKKRQSNRQTQKYRIQSKKQKYVPINHHSSLIS